MIPNIPKQVDLERLFLYFIATMDPVVESDYVIVYIHVQEANRPPFGWMKRIYGIFSRKCVIQLQTAGANLISKPYV